MKATLTANDSDLKKKLHELEVQVRQAMSELTTSLRSEISAGSAPSGPAAEPATSEPILEVKVKTLELKMTNIESRANIFETRADRGEEGLKAVRDA